MLCKEGNGGAASFRRDKWLGNTPLCNIFPRLFLISEQKEGMVRDFRVCNGESGVDSLFGVEICLFESGPCQIVFWGC